MTHLVLRKKETSEKNKVQLHSKKTEWKTFLLMCTHLEHLMLKETILENYR